MSNELAEQGVALLHGVFLPAALSGLRQAAAGCFQAIENGSPLPERCRYNRFSNSVLLTALLEFGCGGLDELLAPIAAAGFDPEACMVEDSWVRKKAPPQFHSHSWHQDGALRVNFPADPREPADLTPLVTLWVPLDACGVDAPGLEFVRRRLDSLLHFTELNDADLRRRFAPEDFWAPQVDPGDALVFLNGTLHRTHLQPEMERARLSVEYRLAPGSD